MNTKATIAILGAALSTLLLTTPSQADNISSGNPTSIFAGKTVTASSTYPAAQFSGGNLVDGTTKAFLFADTDLNPTVSISGFNSALTSIRFFDEPAFQARTAPSVTIYASSVNQTVLTPGSYTLVGTYTLATSASDLYTTATSPADTSSNGNGTISYDTVSGLNIAAGTKSVLFQFGLDPNGSGGGNFGSGFAEIQAFNKPVPEASSSISLGLMLALGGLVVVARKRSIKA